MTNILDEVCELLSFHVFGGKSTAEELRNAVVDKSELEKLQGQIDHLESMRPHWAQGYSSDSIAAQTSFSALNQLWQLLGVNDQTAAVEKLKELVERQNHE